MCLAIPGKVIKVEGDTATVDYQVEQREASLALIPDVKVGDYVLVQARIIVEIIPDEEAKDALAAIKEAGEAHA